MTGKNVLQISGKTTTIADVTFTYNSNGSISVNGTNSGTSPILHCVGAVYKLNGQYIISGCPDYGSSSSYMATIRKNSGGDIVIACDAGPNGTLDPGNPSSTFARYSQDAYYFIRIAPGYACSNLVFWPMVRPSFISNDTYESSAYRNQLLTTRLLATETNINDHYRLYSKFIDTNGDHMITLSIANSGYNRSTFMLLIGSQNAYKELILIHRHCNSTNTQIECWYDIIWKPDSEEDLIAEFTHDYLYPDTLRYEKIVIKLKSIVSWGSGWAIYPLGLDLQQLPNELS